MDYTDLGKLQYLLAQNEVLTEDTEYTDKVIIHALFPESDKEMLKKKITEATSGRVMTQEGEEVYFGDSGMESELYFKKLLGPQQIQLPDTFTKRRIG